MKLLLMLLLLLLLPGDLAAVQGVIFQRRPQAMCSNNVASPLLYEDFENATGYDLAGWGEDIVGPGVINEDYTGVVLHGTQSLLVEEFDDDSTQTTNSFAASDHVWAHFRLRPTSMPSGLDSTVFRLNDASGNCQVRITLNSDGELRLQFACGGLAYQGSAVMTVNTTYTVWLEYDNDNGANAYGTLAFSTTEIRPTSGANFIDGTGTLTATQVSHVQIGKSGPSGGEDVHFILDHLIIDNEQIPDCPYVL